MTAPKFTPGPWVVAPNTRTGNGTDWREIHATSGEFSPSYVGEALECDARLIAAAPELYAALRAIVELHDRGHIEGLANSTEGETGTLRVARTALGKAGAP